ncbi:hypothetical protein M407DRAFT_29177 [Tulasnella calospora MUT 4182]|uniref:Uncharacterized protein n=1 Tax=Tulasnella calospora MUT 4182 TaxID=1051891 RepID=A0A0C3QAJ4_9AGAM|nr:hypothetical protein M407DRAFT_29177 [Tulasnella calospora MUT 4182]
MHSSDQHTNSFSTHLSTDLQRVDFALYNANEHFGTDNWFPDIALINGKPFRVLRAGYNERGNYYYALD